MVKGSEWLVCFAKSWIHFFRLSTGKCCSWNSDEFILFAVYPSDNSVVRIVMTELSAAAFSLNSACYSIVLKIWIKTFIITKGVIRRWEMQNCPMELQWVRLIFPFPYRWEVGAVVTLEQVGKAHTILLFYWSFVSQLIPTSFLLHILIKDVMSSPFRHLPIRSKCDELNWQKKL